MRLPNIKRTGITIALIVAVTLSLLHVMDFKFFEVLERCMEGLPKKTARVFMMREVMGQDTDEICKELGITSSNCWVLLYRARMALRECLEGRWFAAGGAT